MTQARQVQLTELVKGSQRNGVERFALNSNILNEMQSVERLLQSEVAVISVAGAFRKGKSFLLNFFLRYLQAGGHQGNGNWIQSSDDGDGFHWRSGSERDTTGILIWSEPYFIKRQDGSEVAVLLMDTQGTFDHQSTQQDCTTIFAFSTLISSVQIFNISQNIQETDLQHLRLFVEFAAMASDSQDKVLQHLWFLIRDWQFPEEHEFGAAGGDEYLGKVLECGPDKPRENQELRQGIRRYFQKTSCCLLPHPGLGVTRRGFQGELDKMNPDFVREMEKFVTHIFSPDYLVTKAVNGRPLTGQDVFNFAGVYYEAFRSGKLPSPKTIFSATVDMTNIAVAKTAREMFDREVQSRVTLDAAIGDAELEQILNSVLQSALEHFDKKCMEKGAVATQECRMQLMEDLQAQFHHQRLLQQLRSDKIAAEQRSQMLADGIESLQAENLEATERMTQMEMEFERKLNELSRSMASKEELEETLEKESMKHRLAQEKMVARHLQLESTIEMIGEESASLLKEMQAQQRVAVELGMQQLKQRSEDEAKRRRESQKQSNNVVTQLFNKVQSLMPATRDRQPAPSPPRQGRSPDEEEGCGQAQQTSGRECRQQ